MTFYFTIAFLQGKPDLMFIVARTGLEYLRSYGYRDVSFWPEAVWKNGGRIWEACREGKSGLVRSTGIPCIHPHKNTVQYPEGFMGILVNTPFNLALISSLK